MKGADRTVLAFIDLVQDMDVLLPVLERLHLNAAVTLRVVVSRWLRSRAPRIERLLQAHRIKFRFVDRSMVLRGWSPSLRGVDILLTASESSASPHRWSHALTRRASAKGVSTFTVQHGLDNLAALADGPDRNWIASDVLFCWPPESEYPPGLDATARAKLISVGRPRPLAAGGRPHFDVGVFENLHAKAYSDTQRQLVLDGILGLARTRPGLKLYVRAHPAGGWLDQAADALGGCPNITFVSSSAAREDVEDGLSIVRDVARVITTPSTVALDAAQLGRPVALALDGGGLYEPLPWMTSIEAWTSFADAPVEDTAPGEAFVARHVRPGDAVDRIVDRIMEPAVNSDARRILSR